MSNKPRLFGVTHSNRNFENPNSWGKNQFNSSFPASLACYLASVDLDNNYITLNENLDVEHKKISTTNLFGMDSTSDDLFFAFEAAYTPFQQYLIGTLPRVDLVLQNRNTGVCTGQLEVKLTALPDNTTCDLTDGRYGTELVIRPDTIVYMACSLADKFQNNREELLEMFPVGIQELEDWTEAGNVLPYIRQMVQWMDAISARLNNNQTPLVMQPVWKTEGKSSQLADNCLDIFIWSDLAFTRLFTGSIRNENEEITKINRQTRTLVWICKMLLEYAQTGQFNHEEIIDQLSYNTKNDKAFAVSGTITHQYMTSPELTTPRITQSQIKNIVLGGGQTLLSPERRFDAIIFNSPELFN